MSSVQLHVYDLSQGMAKQMSQALLGKQLDGIWHTGVVVYHKEWFYGGGIQTVDPNEIISIYGMHPVDVLDLGFTSHSYDKFVDYINGIRSRFTAETYDLFYHNCNNFSNEVVNFLLNKNIPQHLLDLPHEALNSPLGVILRPVIDQLQQSFRQQRIIPFNNHHSPDHSESSASSSNALTIQQRLNKPVLIHQFHLPWVHHHIKKLEPFAPDSTINQLKLALSTSSGNEKQTEFLGQKDALQWINMENANSRPLFSICYLFHLFTSSTRNISIILSNHSSSVESFLNYFLTSSNSSNLTTKNLFMFSCVLNQLSVFFNGFQWLCDENKIGLCLQFIFNSLYQQSSSFLRLVSAHVLINCCRHLNSTTDSSILVQLFYGLCEEIQNEKSMEILIQRLFCVGILLHNDKNKLTKSLVMDCDLKTICQQQLQQMSQTRQTFSSDADPLHLQLHLLLNEIINNLSSC